MKIYFNRPIKKEAWGGGSHFITGFYEYLIKLGVNVCFDLDSKNIDFIFMFDPRPDSSGKNGVNHIYQYIQMSPKTKVIQRINDTDIARPLDKPWRIELLLYANQIASHTIFISKWLKNHYIEKGFNDKKNHTVITNGCNQKYYFPKNKKSIKDRKVKIITHHWSDNYMKGFDIYNYLDQHLDFQNYEFSYMGRYNKQYAPKNIKLIPPKYGMEVGNVLRAHDIYITGAKFEACGMHHIEAASCGLPVIYHKDGGGIVEMCKSHGVEVENEQQVLHAIEKIIKNYNVYCQKIDYDRLSEEESYKKYLNVMEKENHVK